MNEDDKLHILIRQVLAEALMKDKEKLKNLEMKLEAARKAK